MRDSLQVAAGFNLDRTDARSILLSELFYLLHFAALDAVVGLVLVVAFAGQSDVLVLGIQLILTQLTFSVIPFLVAVGALNPVFAIEQVICAAVVLRVHLAAVVTEAVLVVEAEAAWTKAELVFEAQVVFQFLGVGLTEGVRTKDQIRHPSVDLHWHNFHGLILQLHRCWCLGFL
jgi:hypothetical protein